MYGKISDEIMRKEKVRKVKGKILSEIKTNIDICKKEMQSNISDEDFAYCIKECFVLLELKNYLNNDNSFMNYEAKYYDKDIVIYIISDKNLNIWLQEDYSFVSKFLDKVQDNGYDVFPLLNDRYLEYNFTSSVNRLLYDKKQKCGGFS